ncbi:helix-turn-helix domain-containing protein [Actinomyces provencensis]|uniref:helix-turn-helix domain-containing protein n=1 Tax=Actinomyces provencensis TaxID=1720198 RepID=UPI0038994932
MFCPACGVQAVADGRQQRLLHDIRVFGVPVLLVWSRRTWRCRQHSCPQVSWGEETQLAPPRTHFTTRALTWAVNQLLTRDVAVSALARDLQVGWHTLWKAIEGPLQERLKEISDQASVEALGLDDSPARCAPSGRYPQRVAPFRAPQESDDHRGGGPHEAEERQGREDEALREAPGCPGRTLGSGR